MVPPASWDWSLNLILAEDHAFVYSALKVHDFSCLVTQIKEYYHHYRPRIASKQEDLLYLRPFADYIRWNENKVVLTIKNELDWEKNPHTDSTWRGDCEVALLKSYLYKKTLGFNDKDDGLSCLIRDNQISREEALERLETEGEVPEEAIRELFDKLGLDYSHLKIEHSSAVPSRTTEG
jgi:hypothetical protein